MSPVWPALAIALPLTYGFLHTIAAPLYLQLRGDRHAWKKPTETRRAPRKSYPAVAAKPVAQRSRPVPMQRGPRGLTREMRRVYLARTTAPTETRSDAA